MGYLELCLCVCSSLSCVQLFMTPWIVTCQPPLSMRFLRQEYWSGLPFLSPGDLPDPRIKPMSPALQVISYITGRFFSAKPPGIPNLELQRMKTGESYGSL